MVQLNPLKAHLLKVKVATIRVLPLQPEKQHQFLRVVTVRTLLPRATKLKVVHLKMVATPTKQQLHLLRARQPPSKGQSRLTMLR